MKKHLLFLILALLLLQHSILFAGLTGKISGKVTDATTGEALIGANIILLSRWVEGEEQPLSIPYGASTDLDGQYLYLISNLAFIM